MALNVNSIAEPRTTTRDPGLDAIHFQADSLISANSRFGVVDAQMLARATYDRPVQAAQGARPYAGVTLRIPVLRERKTDILPLAESFLCKARYSYNSPARGFSAAARRALESYSGPGNVRELQHVVERSALLAQGTSIQTDDLQLSDTATPASIGSGGELSDMTLEQAEIRICRPATA